MNNKTNTLPTFPTLSGWLESNMPEVDALIFDIDGVLLVKGKAAEGSNRVMKMLRREKIPFYLLTNDGDHSTQEKASIIRQSGLEIFPEEIVSCADGLMELPVRAKKRKSRENGQNPGTITDDEPFFIMGNLGNPCFAQKAGMNTTRNLEKINSCQGIIVGERNYDWEKTINAAVNFFVKKPYAPLIVPNPDEYYPGSQGELCIGAGGVARFIVQILKTYGITVTPDYLGKPFTPIFKKTHSLLEEKYGKKIPLNRILMTGDYINSDIKGAINFGCLSAIVLTGVTTMEMLDKSDTLPDMVFRTLG
ncbi:Putative sugar phosphatase, haloalkanoate dehalogenase (HAD) superfamily [Desulfamplus magnetovallimortis]|uniref:Putative sugar phosphatase, haloalkanoate dehalogenase (HAD) superfamily n=1 Tax=Desulfamplus magnetovallimortis TaxID=1246637 RepID=L0R557_9BACT|nr:HAD hydrolase-like protein [Desulfamplus magnetovallimortis]CCO06655.1 Putative sugar phosphatase, haloalkanoate dehalogenase (HAD) superfamily [Desulfamplus magnetovallimortis BW-1]SLM32706.1 Putative sugar phosphatase, haloalkanoate dehalogenase (HAD) superfamily [Desulfamplus magnetovallimortis]